VKRPATDGAGHYALSTEADTDTDEWAKKTDVLRFMRINATIHRPEKEIAAIAKTDFCD